MAKVDLYQEKSNLIFYTNSGESTIGYNTIINLNTRIGIAGADIEAGEIGTVYVEGVFKMPKATGAVTLGQLVYYDPSADNITTTKTSMIPAGYAVAAAGADDTTVVVKLLG